MLYKHKITKTTFLFFIAIVLLSCGNRKNANEIKVSDIHIPASADEKVTQKIAENMPVLTFEKVLYDFGKVMQGERLSYSFKFTNTGKSNLIIEGTSASCGCTTTTPPKAPIRPGESGEIKVTFDSKTKQGPVVNSIVISANTYPVHTVIKVLADVIIP